jgi:pimeloyl-ACP methyl ester carboxylesterase/ketosteroid isomerase-like protein
MRRFTSILTAFLLAFSAFATFADDVRDDVRNAELSFAKAFADRDQAKFFAHVLDDASFVSPGGTLSGKKAVVERWSRFFAGPQAPFSWAPDRVAVNAAGTIGLSAGPVFDPNGVHVGYFNSVWVKQSDGAWKVLFDGPGSPAACLPESVPPITEGDITTPDGAKLHYKKIGDGGRTLIVPLGFILYDDFKQLADAATIITYDLRDRGRSSRVEDVNTLTIQQDVKDLETVRQHFNVDKFVPVGFSYLGLMVAMYTAEHPEHVTRVIQLGPVPMKYGTKYPQNLTNENDEPVQRWHELNAKKDTTTPQHELCLAQEKALQSLLVGNQAHASRIKSTCELENEWPASLDRHFRASFQSIMKVDFGPADLAKITMPVLTIHGTKDRNAPYGSGREWAKSLPNARLVTIEGGAHAMWVDDPLTVFGAIREFLRGAWPLGAEKL